MVVRIVTSAIVLAAAVAIGVAIFFFLLLALNGVSERVANYAFPVFILGGSLVSAASALGGFLLSGFFERKEWNPVLNAAVSVVVFVGLAFVLKIVLLFIAVSVAEAVRKGW